MGLPHLFSVVFYALLAGIIGTAGGGLAGILLPPGSRRATGFLLDYAAGLMLSVICFTLLPGAFELASLFWIICGLLTGFAFMSCSDALIRRLQGPDGASGLKATGLAMAVGVAIHNLPEGIAIGSGFEADMRLGLSLAVAIALHDVPEGASISLTLRAGGVSGKRAFLAAALSGVPMLAGAVFGFCAGRISALAIALCLSFAAGAMLYLVFGDMLPEAQKIRPGRFSALGCSLGVISGIVLAGCLG